ncbi:MAG: UDP-3-O-acyl-N-acetylglucosamine deacetylase [bacterium]
MSDTQKTIAKNIFFKGIGLHTGNITRITLKPSPANYGIRFFREDFPEAAPILATYENVIGIMRGTTIGNDTVHIHTVEHLLAAFYGMGIDNIEIHIDGNEPPVADGSAASFVNIIQEAGIVDQEVEKDYLVIDKEVHYKNGDTVITANKFDGLKIEAEIIYNHPFIKSQRFEINVDEKTFIEQLSNARTFCFDYEIETLKKSGLAKGGSLDNAVVIGMDKIYSKNNGLRYQDEFIRHKILDLMGDLYLLGRPIKAHIKAVRPGHEHNINFVKAIFQKYQVSG